MGSRQRPSEKVAKQAWSRNRNRYRYRYRKNAGWDRLKDQAFSDGLPHPEILAQRRGGVFCLVTGVSWVDALMHAFLGGRDYPLPT